jgi:hypothetical protein
MQLGADARVGIWPHRDATTAYALAVDREFSEIVAVIEREEENRRARLSPDEEPTSRTAVDALRQTIAQGRTAEAIALMEADSALVGAGDMQGVTPLYLAARKHDPALVGWLLDRGALVDSRNAEGKTPLQVAAVAAGWAPERHDVIFYFMENTHVDPARFYETARLLLEKGAELTPHAAVALGDREAVLRLYREGRLTNVTDTLWKALRARYASSATRRAGPPQVVARQADKALEKVLPERRHGPGPGDLPGHRTLRPGRRAPPPEPGGRPVTTPLTIRGSVPAGRRSTAAAGPSTPPGRVPRVARLLALALRCERLVADGVVAGYGELARLGHVSRARVSQVMALRNLAPDLQERVLFSSATKRAATARRASANGRRK